MKSIGRILTLTGLASFGLCFAQGAELKVGDVCPDWKMTGSDGKTYQAADFKDKQAVVIAWFPKAFTGG